jgi:hypothetical protein
VLAASAIVAGRLLPGASRPLPDSGRLLPNSGRQHASVVK